MQISPYLTFRGNCREAMSFYQSCFGGALSIQTVEESPIAKHLPKELKDYVLQSTLCNEGLSMQGSDMVAEEGLFHGNRISLSIESNNIQEIKSLYQKLSEGGTQNEPLTYNYWGILLGEVTDKFGTRWMLHCKAESSVAETISQTQPPGP